jgi:tetratricopeptide (TPR) repeat protein
MTDFSNLIDSLLIVGDVDAALEALNSHLNQFPDDSEAQHIRQRILQRSGALVDDVPDFQTENDVPLTIQLERLYDAGRWSEIEALLPALPSHWHGEAWRGRIALEQGLADQAAAHFSAALTDIGTVDRKSILYPQRALLLLQRAEAYRQLKDWKAADHDFAAAERMIPTDPIIPFMRALMIYRLHNGSQSAFHKVLPICRDALDSATTALREQMRDALKDDPFYKPLAEALIGSQ